jgi:hypothetical protein
MELNVPPLVAPNVSPAGHPTMQWELEVPGLPYFYHNGEVMAVDGGEVWVVSTDEPEMRSLFRWEWDYGAGYIPLSTDRIFVAAGTGNGDLYVVDLEWELFADANQRQNFLHTKTLSVLLSVNVLKVRHSSAQSSQSTFLFPVAASRVRRRSRAHRF